MASVRVQSEDFDVTAESEALGGDDVGALVSFVGLCRGERGTLKALEIEHYPGMAEAEMARVAAEAEARWPLHGLTIIHRHGAIPVGGRIVLVVASSAHRRAAFEAAEFLMDYLKTRAPFWKRTHLVDGSIGEWVEAKADDDSAAERWSLGRSD